MIKEIESTHHFSTEESLYNLLDSADVTDAHDKRLAVLRKVQFRNTKDGKPFIRAVFEDCNGYCLIGRMFDCNDISNIGKTFTSLVGALVLIEYDVDYYNGSLCLQLQAVERISETVANNYAAAFQAKYTLAETRLRDCTQILGSLNMNEQLIDFCRAYCGIGSLKNVSDETVCKGLRGYILEILYRVLAIRNDVSVESLIAFVYAILVWFSTRSAADSNSDDNDMLFIASMMDKRVAAVSSGLPTLAAKLSELAAMFTGMSRVISGDTYLLYNLYKVFVESSNVMVLEKQLPPGGFCTYRNQTIRRS